MVNGGFEGNLDGWEEGGSDNLSGLRSDDVNNCTDSTSIFLEIDFEGVGAITQCINVESDTDYAVGFDYQRGPNAIAGCQWQVYEGSCGSEGEFLDNWSLSSPTAGSSPDSEWLPISTTYTTPAGGGALHLACVIPFPPRERLLG